MSESNRDHLMSDWLYQLLESKKRKIRSSYYSSNLVLKLRHKSTVFDREKISMLQDSRTIDLVDFTSLVFLMCESDQFQEMYDLLRNLKSTDFPGNVNFYDIFERFPNWEYKLIEILTRLNNKEASLLFSEVLLNSMDANQKHSLNAPRVTLYRICDELNENDRRQVVEHMESKGAPKPAEHLPFLELYFMLWHVKGFLNLDQREGFDYLASALYSIGKPDLAGMLGWHPGFQNITDLFDTEFPVEIYPIKKPEAVGLCLIINQLTYGGQGGDRESSIVDVKKLTARMQELNFLVLVIMDVESYDFCQTIRTLVNAFFSDSHSIFMLVVMAHGDPHGILCMHRSSRNVFSSDYNNVTVKRIRIDEIRDTILDLEVLINIPKIFLCNACRGDLVFAPLLKTEMAELIFQPIIPNKIDLIICFSTLPNFVSFRDKHKGSLFINVLCDVLNQKPDIEVCELFTLVNARLMKPSSKLSDSFKEGHIGNKLSLANPIEFISRLTKKLYLKLPDFET